MEISTLNSVLIWVGIFAAFLTAFSFLGTWWTGAILAKENDAKIHSLQETVVSMKPSIFSQEILAQNVPDGNLFKQQYRISINSPDSHAVIITRLTSTARRVGDLQSELVGDGGIRQYEGKYTFFQDIILTFWTDKALNEKTDSVKFLFQDARQS